MGRDDHSMLVDDKEQHWVLCPSDNNRIPLSERPKYCPFCGEFIGWVNEETKTEKTPQIPD